jgi:hypothetical protein
MGGAEMSQVGVELASRLGLQLNRREGHDLAGPCIACNSGDAFRLHQQSGVGYCYSCQGKWSPFQFAEAVLGDRGRAKALLIEMGVFPSSGTRSQPRTDPIEVIARQKGITPEALRAFGARSVSATAIRLPAYGPDGKPCTTFSMTVQGGKGRFAKGQKAGLFFPHENGKVRLPQAGELWHLVEGPKDAAALHGLGLLGCGLNTCRLAAKFARLFAGSEVVLIPDRDRASEEGSQFSARVLRGVVKSVRIGVLPAEFKESKGDDVRDVLRRPDGREQVLQAITDAREWRPETSAKDALDDRPQIEVTPEEHEVNDQAVRALARDVTLFQRAEALVRILHDHSPRALKGIVRPANAPRIVPIREATLRERLTTVARFLKRMQSEEGEDLMQVHPPAFCTRAVAARRYWPDLRHLEGVVCSPILRRDGTVLQTPGYDSTTGLFYEPAGETMEVPQTPTFEDVCAARDALLEVVIDFPFARPAHQSAWLALVLTPLARYAFDGPSPLFLMDANIRGTGKSLLADAGSLIVTGRPIARMSCPEKDEEIRKLITAIALGGDQMILIDNISGELGSPSLDAALTGTIWKDRILGRSEIVEMPLVTTWAATGNNIVLRADTSRRACHMRLHSELENPEERRDFRHPDLLGWVRKHRPRLLSSALTLLAAFFRAGRPERAIKPWGSFEGWSGLVRQALVWLDLPDPGETREELARSSDREAGALRALLEGWSEIDPDGSGLTAAKLVERLDNAPGQFELVRTAVLELCPASGGKFPGPRAVGNKFRKLCGRVVGAKALDKRDWHGTAVWFVMPVGQGKDGSDGGDGCSSGSSCSVPR